MIAPVAIVTAIARKMEPLRPAARTNVIHFHRVALLRDITGFHQPHSDGLLSGRVGPGAETTTRPRPTCVRELRVLGRPPTRLASVRRSARGTR